MADISKINAVLLANIAEIDDVLAANIAKVNGLVFSTAPAFTGLLDTYTGAEAAYSTRRLYSLYTGAALRVRRDSDDTEQDIGFDSNGDLDTSALATFVGSGNNGYVTKWYGQESSGGTGSGNDAAQSTGTAQPQIYNGTAVLTENGQPTIQFDGSNDMLTLPTISIPSVATLVNKCTDTAGKRNLLTIGGSFNFSYNQSAASSFGFRPSGTGSGNSYDQTQSLFFADRTGTTVVAYKNGTQATQAYNASHTSGVVAIGSRGTSHFFLGNAQEIVMWTTDHVSNRSGIEGNVNAHYQIGNFGAPTSGLLYDYSGAAAAYSVRQLANTAALAMRIREDGTDTETDIGFDANGDLDTAAISSHCGANNGYVVTWYDQSGNSNDATQSTSGSQPQIYNGSAVITDNGKPAISGANDLLEASSISSGSEDRSIYMVYHANTVSNTERFFDLTDTNIVTTGNCYTVTTEVGVRCRFTTYVPGGGTTDQSLLSIEQDTSENPELRMYLNSTETGSGGNISENVTVGPTRIFGSAQGVVYTGTIQEVIIYAGADGDQSSNRSGIETNINNYFSIY